MNTFLAPIEKPQGVIMKLVYYFSRRRFGKVLTPLKVYAVRMPLGFGLFQQKISKLDKRLTLPAEMILLIRQMVARIHLPA